MFAGRRYDIEIGLYYNRARYYNPYTGRFLQVDPIGYGDGMNMYAYCKNKPLIFTDPSGLDAAPNDPNNIMYGELQVVTGRYWVVPEQFNLGDPIPRAIGTDILEDKINLGLGIIQIDMSGSNTVAKIDAQLANYEGYLEAVSHIVGSEIHFSLNLKLGWRAYIEVKDWKDLNENDKVDSDDEFSEPYWIEITGFPSGSSKNKDTTYATFFGGRYMTKEAAADAAGTAIHFAWIIGIPGVLPSAAEVLQWTDESVIDPYNRETHY
jgi:RHS repeat-associated protein